MRELVKMLSEQVETCRCDLLLQPQCVFRADLIRFLTSHKIHHWLKYTSGQRGSTPLPKMSDPILICINRFTGSIFNPLSTLPVANSSTASDLPPSARIQLWRGPGTDVKTQNFDRPPSPPPPEEI